MTINYDFQTGVTIHWDKSEAHIACDVLLFIAYNTTSEEVEKKIIQAISAIEAAEQIVPDSN